MTLRRWLDERRPPPPPEVREGLAVGGVRADTAEGRVDALAMAALKRLGQARAHPGRIRESAFHLLAADALVTYACEAALESEDVEGSLSRLTDTGGGQ